MSHKQPYFIFFTDCGPTEEMIEVSASAATGGEGTEVCAGTGGERDAVGGEVSTSTSEELDLDQVKGRMLTMAGLFEIWRNSDVSKVFLL